MDDDTDVGSGLTAEELESGTVRIDRRYWVQIKGRWHPTWPGVLDAATRSGLRALKTRIVQLPATDNEYYAAVSVEATFEDGRVFEAVGDCSPASTSPALVPASLRLAETRAKARACRDAINVGTPAADEIGPDRPQRQQPRPAQAQQQRQNGGGDAGGFCSYDGCGVEITRNQKLMSQHHTKSDLCPTHLQEARTAKKG